MGANLIDMTGNVYGRLTVVRRADNIGKQTAWLCKCSCGGEKVIRGYSLRDGVTKSCGCLYADDLTGNVYGKLTAISRANNRGKQVFWLCQCSCGNKKEIRASSLVAGLTKSCGCLGFIDLAGCVYGKLTVIKRFGNSSPPKWFCRCSCGNERVIRGSHLRGGQQGCGCGRLEKAKEEVGNIYGRLTVIRRVQNVNTLAAWLCRCSCGIEVEVVGAALRSGNTKSCGCMKTLGYGEAAFNGLYNRNELGAMSRGLEWSLTKKQVKEITKQDCFYCGAEPFQVYTRGSSTGDYIYNGLDRVNNDLGYIVGNVVPCCGICNLAKRKHSIDDFAKWIEKVYLNWSKEHLVGIR